MEYDLRYLMKVVVCYGACSIVTKPVFRSTGVVPSSKA